MLEELYSQTVGEKVWPYDTDPLAEFAAIV